MKVMDAATGKIFEWDGPFTLASVQEWIRTDMVQQVTVALPRDAGQVAILCDEDGGMKSLTHSCTIFTPVGAHAFVGNVLIVGNSRYGWSGLTDKQLAEIDLYVDAKGQPLIHVGTRP